MSVAIVRVIICYHFVLVALETHTFIASTAHDLEASIYSYYWHPTRNIGTSSHSVFSHILSKQRLSALFGLLASQTLVKRILHKNTGTLHRRQ